MAVPRERVGPRAEVAQDIGLAAILGGNLFARFGMHPALRGVGDARERGKVVNSAWRRYGTINSLGLAALLAGRAGSQAERHGRRSQRERVLGAARDAALAMVTASGVAAAIEGMRFARMEPEGAVPLEDGSEAGGDASPDQRAAKSRLNLLAGLHLASALTLAAVNAALRQAASAPPPRRWSPIARR
jgi:hypothetical protein